MNDVLENKMSRNLAVLGHFKNNAAIWAANVHVTSCINGIESRIVEVQGLNSLQEADKKGITDAKLFAREGVIKQSIKVQGPLMAYASSIDDVILLKAIGFSKSHFDYKRDTALYDVGSLIYDTAMPLAVQLAGFMLPQAEIDSLGSKLTDYINLIQTPRIATSEQVMRKNKIAELMKEIDVLLKSKLNYLMLPYRSTEPDFYNTYKNTMIIVDLGHRNKRGTILIKGKTIQFENGEPMLGVSVSIQGVMGLSTLSGPDGSYELWLKESGTVVLLGEMPGYYPYDESLDVEKNMVYEINIEMEPKVVIPPPPPIIPVPPMP